MKKAILIFSGGIDSTTLLYDIKKEFKVFALTFNYGQKHLKEIEYAKKTCKKLGIKQKIIDIQSLNKIMVSALTSDMIDIPEGHYEDEIMKLTTVPNRNMILISIAVSYAIMKDADYVFFGAHAGDRIIYPDCRAEYIYALNKAINICDWKKIELKAPYIKMDKVGIIKRGIELSVDYSNTWSCYKGKEKACGKCGTCVERLEAFEKNGIKDPIQYYEVK